MKQKSTSNLRKRLNISIGITVVIFLSLTLVSKLFKVTDLPLQTIGALLGAVVSALITYFLLMGQTQAEELKERNVKVFEEKSAHYKNFINKMWEMWADKNISKAEIVQLKTMVAKDIILFTEPETVEKILDHISKISKLTENSTSSENDTAIQNEILQIINHLAVGLNLGGKITPKIAQHLNDLC